MDARKRNATLVSHNIRIVSMQRKSINCTNCSLLYAYDIMFNSGLFIIVRCNWNFLFLFAELDIFHIGKRIGPFVHWEPIFIGTNFEPLYDERLSWEGKSDKMTQVYI